MCAWWCSWWSCAVWGMSDACALVGWVVGVGVLCVVVMVWGVGGECAVLRMV